MFEYILHFYENYQIIFYFLLIIGLIFEGPIIILSLSLLSSKLGFSFFEILFLAFLGHFFGDLIYFIFARFFRNKIKKDFLILKKIDKKLKNKSLFSKLLVIKYTPPLTVLGLFYLGYTKIKFIDFVKNDILINIFGALLLTIIGFFFGKYFTQTNNFIYFIMLLFFVFMIFYFILKIIAKYIIKKILK